MRPDHGRDTRDHPPRDNAPRDQITRDHAPRDQATREQITREQMSRDKRYMETVQFRYGRSNHPPPPPSSSHPVQQQPIYANMSPSYDPFASRGSGYPTRPSYQPMIPQAISKVDYQQHHPPPPQNTTSSGNIRGSELLSDV
eukprot:sb/3474177/